MAYNQLPFALNELEKLLTYERNDYFIIYDKANLEENGEEISVRVYRFIPRLGKSGEMEIKKNQLSRFLASEISDENIIKETAKCMKELLKNREEVKLVIKSEPLPFLTSFVPASILVKLYYVAVNDTVIVDNGQSKVKNNNEKPLLS